MKNNENRINLDWDDGLLWLYINNEAIPFNSYEAKELLEKLKQEEERIDAQVFIDKCEGL